MLKFPPSLSRILQSHRERLRSESGQSVILIATVIISFIMFFGFAVNTGLLVNAKISLQSAADAAAYAGAATQARQLNAISFLNYDMKRQYKKFLYRYAVVGSLGNPDYANPVNPQKSGYYNFGKQSYGSAGSNPTIVPINVPSVCIPLTKNAKSDNCLMVNLPDTAASFPSQGLSQITALLYQQLQAVQNLQKELCTGNSSINFFTLMNWLYKAEPGNNSLVQLFNQFQGTIKDTDRDAALNTVSSLVQGLGLVPRNILHLLRINTLNAFLNEPPVAEATSDLIQGWETSPSADQHERTIQALKSALANLNESVMKPSEVVMQELQAPRQLQLETVKVGFNVYVHYLRPGTSGSGGGHICKVNIVPFPVVGVPVGVRRTDPNSVVHYAVKLKAKARLLFLPVKDGLELEAVAAAKPFGARIGPSRLSETDFVEEIKTGTVNQQVINDCSGQLACKVPNVALVGAGGASFYHSAFLNTLKGLVMSNPNSVDAAAIQAGLKAATAPNPIEIGQYNILPPPRSTQRMAYEFIPYSDDKNIDIYRFYAPITLSSQSDATQQVNSIIDQNFPPGFNNAFGVDLDTLKNQLKTQVAGYVNNSLPNANQSEYDETLTFAAIELPMAGVKSAPTGSAYWLTEANSILTSWGPQYSRVDNGTGAGTIGYQPRFGYSVKFVTLQNLLKAGMPASDDDLSKVNH